MLHNGAKNEHVGINIIEYTTEQPYRHETTIYNHI